MRTTRPMIAIAITTLIATAALGTAPASAAASGVPEQLHSLYAPSAMVLTIADGEKAEPVLRAVTLTCSPTGGDHPDPARACGALQRAKGDYTRIKSSETFCTREYRPVTVTARGVWRGKLVGHRTTYGNACSLHAATGPVFEF